MVTVKKRSSGAGVQRLDQRNRKMLARVGDKMAPCLVPLQICYGSDVVPPNVTLADS